MVGKGQVKKMRATCAEAPLKDAKIRELQTAVAKLQKNVHDAEQKAATEYMRGLEDGRKQAMAHADAENRHQQQEITKLRRVIRRQEEMLGMGEKARLTQPNPRKPAPPTAPLLASSVPPVSVPLGEVGLSLTVWDSRWGLSETIVKSVQDFAQSVGAQLRPPPTSWRQEDVHACGYYALEALRASLAGTVPIRPNYQTAVLLLERVPDEFRKPDQLESLLKDPRKTRFEEKHRLSNIQVFSVIESLAKEFGTDIKMHNRKIKETLKGDPGKCRKSPCQIVFMCDHFFFLRFH